MQPFLKAIAGFTFVLLLSVLWPLISQAQTPQAIPYQATTLNAAGQPLANHPIAVRFSILDSTISGDVLYKELHTISTNALGLFTANIGQGTPVSGTFNTINWAVNNKFLKVELDTTGSGTTFTDLGTQQLLSVPYALHAKTAESVAGFNNGFTHFIGEEFGGGVIFHLWKDAQGVEHGLIVDKIDLSTQEAWSNMDQTLIGVSAQSSWDGLNNSNAIVGQAGHSSSAAAHCLNSTNGGQSDWYLPSIQELSMLWNNYYTVARSLTQIAGATLLLEQDLQTNYWSSSEFNINDAWTFDFKNGLAYNYGKYDTVQVRAVRAF